ncbi:hypothetical protein, partial [Beijerinckia sp. L45]|uniref:hypothetical protein n=1 Tax=Beijerinckia sp. L45 TaxID=1641855 RepID=UPI001AEF3155
MSFPTAPDKVDGEFGTLGSVAGCAAQVCRAAGSLDSCRTAAAAALSRADATRGPMIGTLSM